jgi:hypothetical protein
MTFLFYNFIIIKLKCQALFKIFLLLICDIVTLKLISNNVTMEKVRYLMTKKELVRVYVIKSLIEDKMTSRDAAEVLSLSERQIKRLKAGVKKEGEVFVVHKNRGRKPKHTFPGKIREKIVFLVLTKYKGANYTHLSPQSQAKFHSKSQTFFHSC